MTVTVVFVNSKKYMVVILRNRTDGQNETDQIYCMSIQGL